MLQKCLAIYKERGILELCSRMIQKISCGWISTTHAVWYVKHLSDPSSETRVQTGIPVSVDFYSFADTLNWIKNLNESWMLDDTERIIAEDEKHYWVNIKTDQSIIGYLKIGLNRVYINDYARILSFDQDVAYIYDTFVLPAYRNKNVASYMVREVCGFLQTKGFSRVLCHIPVWNKASSKAYTKVGFKRVKAIRSIKVLGLHFVTSDPRYL